MIFQSKTEARVPEPRTAAPPRSLAPLSAETRIPELSAVMPVYDEEEVLPTSMAEAVAALERTCATWELIVVDDGSTDRTPEILDEWARRDARIRVVRAPENRGYARALILGLSLARHELAFYTDGDGQFDLLELTQLYEHLGNADMVVGYRRNRRDPALRKLTSWVFNRLQTVILGVHTRDVNCAFKLFTRRYLEKVQLSSEDYLIDAEMFARARKAGLTWNTVGVTHRPRRAGHSKVHPTTVLTTLRELWRLRRALRD